MDRASYRALVASLEEVARQSPDALRARVFGHIALGYGYVLFILASIIVTMALVVWAAVAAPGGYWAVKFLLALGAILVVIARSLRVRIMPPEGTPLRLADLPALEARVHEIREALGSPRPDHVLLTEDFNASVTQIPRLGIFGFPTTYLMLGLPLMYALSPTEFDAVLAHEFAHLSGAHPKRGLWAYRMGQTWHQLMDQMQAAKSAGSILFDRFVRWYVPRLDAYGFVMARRDEYSADADAASVTSPRAMGAALVAMHTRGTVFGEQVWAELWSRADREPDPPERSWTLVPNRLRETDAHPLRNAWVGRALVEPPSPSDTHPTLRERLHALGVLAPEAGVAEADHALALLEPFHESAAERYLGGVATARLDQLERQWRAGVQAAWRERFQNRRAARDELDALLARDGTGEALDIATLGRLCVLTAELEGDVAARPVASRLLAEVPEHATAHYILGRGLLAEDDEAGVAHLERVMTIDPSSTPGLANLLHAFYMRRGDRTAITRLEERYDAFTALTREAAEERNTVHEQDTLVTPDLTDEERTMLARVLGRFDGFRVMYVARKLTTHDPERPCVILLAIRGFSLFDSSDETETLNEMIGHVRFARGQDALLMFAQSSNGWLLRKMTDAGAERIRRATP